MTHVTPRLVVRLFQKAIAVGQNHVFILCFPPPAQPVSLISSTLLSRPQFIRMATTQVNLRASNSTSDALTRCLHTSIICGLLAISFFSLHPSGIIWDGSPLKLSRRGGSKVCRFSLQASALLITCKPRCTFYSKLHRCFD